MNLAASNTFQCHVCHGASAFLYPEYESFWRVTSDCKPWPPGGQLAVCNFCSSVQTILDNEWHEEARRIYQDYTIYHQGQGAEQSVFDQSSGRAASRSARLVQRLQQEVQVPDQGRLLDIGCGNGAFLRAFADSFPGWSMAAVEIDERYGPQVKAIDGVEALFTCKATEVPGSFQIITLIHVLEHIPSPRQYLSDLWDKLQIGGVLVIAVPDCEQNPFMFLIADHASHCFVQPLRELISSVGYHVELAVNDWIPKELTFVARKPTALPARGRMAPCPDLPLAVQSRLAWLSEFALRARGWAAQEELGVFGTAIAGTWIFAEVQGRVAFFVDEDLNRIGQTHLGRPILSPSQIPAGAHVVIPMPPLLADTIAGRLARLGVPLYLPPSSAWESARAGPSSAKLNSSRGAAGS